MSKRIGLCRMLAVLVVFAGAGSFAQAASPLAANERVVIRPSEQIVFLKGQVGAYDQASSLLHVGEYQVYVADAFAGIDASVLPGDEVAIVGSEIDSTGFIWAVSVRVLGENIKKRDLATGKASITGTGKQSITGTGIRAQSITGTGRLSITGTGKQSITGTGIRAESITGTGRLSITGTGKQSITGTGIRAESITGTGRLSITGTGKQSITGTGIRAESITGTGRLSITGTGKQSITGTGVRVQSITGTGRLSITGTGSQ